MSVEKLRAQKEKKHFFRNSFRNVLWIIYASMALNIIFIIGIYETIINKKEPNYYATSGVKAPILLSALSHPNETSTPLLPAAPEDDDANDIKVVQ